MSLINTKIQTKEGCTVSSPIIINIEKLFLSMLILRISKSFPVGDGYIKNPFHPHDNWKNLIQLKKDIRLIYFSNGIEFKKRYPSAKDRVVIYHRIAKRFGITIPQI